MKSIYLVIISVVLSSQIFFAQSIRVPQINIDSFSGTEAEVLSEIENLKLVITEAEKNSIDVTKEKMTIRLAEVFLVYAKWDENNVAVNQPYFDAINKFHQSTSENLAQKLPTYERSELISLLKEGQSNLQKIIKGELKRQSTPKVDWSKITYNGNQLIFNGKPVFLADYTWQPDLAGPHDISEYFGGYDGFYIGPNMVSNENGSIANWIVNDLNSKPSGRFGTMFIGHSSIPNWLKEKYPDILEGKGYYTKYDIGNPGAREVIKKLLAGTIPLMKGKNYKGQGVMLTNEPHWNLAGNWEVVQFSEHTKDSLRVWLKNKHKTIATVNALWGKNYGSFDAVDLPAFPMSLTEIGNPIWYDVMKFNQDRVTNWFTFMNNEVLKNDAESKTHIKLIPSMWSGNNRYYGLDFEALTSLTVNIGNDAGAKNSKRWGSIDDWESRYGFDWRHFCMPFDFFRSVSPNKVNYNSEGHFLQAVSFTDLFLDSNYVRSSYWLAVLQGMNSVQSWFWPRTEEGGIQERSEEIAGSAIQQPRVVHEIANTFIDLNANAEHIAALQHLKQHIRIFYSETSAINKTNHMDAVFDLYEAMYFEGSPIGFVTKNIIEKQPNTNWDIVLVHKTEFVTTEELTKLQTYLNNGGTIVLDAISLKKDEYGRAHTVSLNTANGGAIISASSTENFKAKAFEMMVSKGRLPKISLEETNSLNLKGCFWRSYTSVEGKNMISIVNIGKEKAQVKLSLKGASKGLICTNLITGEEFSGNFEMASETVLLLEVRERTIADSKFSIKATGETCPNKNNGKIEILADDVNTTYKITFKGTEFNFTETKTFENIEPGVYELCIKPLNEDLEQCYFVKIEKSNEISAKATVNAKNAVIQINNGTAPFKVFVNANEVVQTSLNSITVPINKGDFIQVKTSKECEGVFTQGSVLAYPNPTKGEMSVFFQTELSEVKAAIYSIHSQLISEKVYNYSNGKISINLNQLPVGVYLLQLFSENPTLIKVVKE